MQFRKYSDKHDFVVRLYPQRLSLFLEFSNMCGEQTVRHFSDWITKFLLETDCEKDKFHSMLCYGVDDEKLRLFEFMFSQQSVSNRQQDLQLIRSGYLPELIHKQTASQIVDVNSGHNLYFFKIIYLNDFKCLAEHLFNIHQINRRHAVPFAIIIDDICKYSIRNNNQNSPDEKAFKRLRMQHDDQLETIMQLCTLLIETINLCQLQLQEPSYLLIGIDLKNYSNDQGKCDDLILKLQNRFVEHSINVDRF